MKKRIATLLSVSMILSSLVMPATTLSVFADDFADDTVMVEEICDDEFIEEDDYEDEFEIETDAFEEETETIQADETESETALETETEENEKFEASGDCGQNLTWNLTGGTLTISGTGGMYPYYDIYDDKVPWENYKSQITKINIGNGVTSFAAGAFSCTMIKEVIVPDSVTSLGNNCFEACPQLEKVTLGKNIKALYWYCFSNCPNLVSINIPDSLEEIGYGVFSDCIGLRKIVLNEDLGMIDDHAFENCYNLEEINIPEICFMGENVFANCKSLRKLTLPESVYIFDDYAFMGCENLTLTIECDDDYSSGLRIYDNAFAYSEDSSEIIPGLHIICYKDSGVESYCKEKNISYSYIETKEEKIRGFIRRLYRTCLNRQADEAGMNYWFDQLSTGKSTGAQAAGGFIFSNESINKNLCHSCFIDQLYNCFLGRDADSNGKAYWMGKIKEGATRAEIFGGFVVSNEFKKLCGEYGITVGSGTWTKSTGLLEGNCKSCGEKNKTVYEFIERMYTTCLGRGSDDNGKTYWLNQIKNGKTGLDVAMGFIFSNELNKKNLNDTQFIQVLYKAFFGRNADSAGAAYWQLKLQGGASRESVVKGFAESKEFKALCIEYGIRAK